MINSIQDTHECLRLWSHLREEWQDCQMLCASDRMCIALDLREKMADIFTVGPGSALPEPRLGYSMTRVGLEDRYELVVCMFMSRRRNLITFPLQCFCPRIEV